MRMNALMPWHRCRTGNFKQIHFSPEFGHGLGRLFDFCGLQGVEGGRPLEGFGGVFFRPGQGGGFYGFHVQVFLSTMGQQPLAGGFKIRYLVEQLDNPGNMDLRRQRERKAAQCLNIPARTTSGSYFLL